MDKQIYDCWIVYSALHPGTSVDRMICDPNKRYSFLADGRLAVPNASEFEILWSLMRLRKGKKLEKSVATASTS